MIAHRLALALALASVGCIQPLPQPDEPLAAARPPSLEAAVAASGADDRPYTLRVSLRFERDRWLNLRFEQALALRARRIDGWLVFVAERQLEPGAMMFTWKDGLFGGYKGAVKTLAEPRDPQGRSQQDEASHDYQRALARGEAVVADWKRDYADQLSSKRWQFDPRIMFATEAPVAGCYAFALEPSGAAALDGEGQLAEATVLDRVGERYRYHVPGQQDPVPAPRFYAATSHALALLAPAGLPPTPETARWERPAPWALASLVRVAVAIFPDLRGTLGSPRARAMTVRATAERAGDRLLIEARSAPLGDAEVGGGYQLEGYERSARWRLGGADRWPEVERVVLRGSRGQDRILLTLELRAGESSTADGPSGNPRQ